MTSESEASKSSLELSANDDRDCYWSSNIRLSQSRKSMPTLETKREKQRTVLLQNLYRSTSTSLEMEDPKEKQCFEDFYEEVYLELYECYGKIRQLHVCQNVGDHMRGNVYVQFYDEEDAIEAVEALNARWFSGQPIYAELSPVSNFKGSAICRQFENGYCERGNFCNFLHIRPLSSKFIRKLRRTLTTMEVGRSGKRRRKILESNEESNLSSSSHSSNGLPQSYRVDSSSSSEDDSASSSTLSDSPCSSFTSQIPANDENVPTTDIDLSIPIAFCRHTFREAPTAKKRRRISVNGDGETDEEISDNEMRVVHAARQLIRNYKWQLLKRRLLMREISTTAKEL